MRWILFLLSTLLQLISSSDAVLTCLAGNPEKPGTCTSNSYCVTIRSKNAPIQMSCDGNAVGHISLCSAFSTRARMSQTDYYYTSQHSSASRQRTQHQQVSSDIQQNCFDGGQLGQICCCSTNFCNYSTQKLQLFAFIGLFFFILL